MGKSIDPVDFFIRDIALCILSLLVDPADIVRASIVSHSWRNFIIENGLSKKLCLRKAPTLANITSTVEKTDVELIMYLNTNSWEVLAREHEIYTFFLRALSKSAILPKHCIECVIGASSTNRHLEESVVQVLLKRDSYWSSRGQDDPKVPERIIFQLNSRVCIINEIDIWPSGANWGTGSPVHSANSVRFRIGHPRSSMDFKVNIKSLPLQQLEDKYVWTYTSPEFPMTQESYLQPFKLPEPVICVGGFLQIELLGRAQRNESDGLYYLRIGHVRVLGHPLSPAFDVEMGFPGSFSLIYCPNAFNSVLKKISQVEEDSDEDRSDCFRLWHLQIAYLIHFLHYPREDPWYLDYALGLHEGRN